MARPPLAPPDEVVSLHLHLKREQIEKLVKLCKASGLQRPAMIRKLIDEATV